MATTDDGVGPDGGVVSAGDGAGGGTAGNGGEALVVVLWATGWKSQVEDLVAGRAPRHLQGRRMAKETP